MSFLGLPLELHHEIASYLVEDKDLCALTAVCTQSYANVNSDCNGLWRALFNQTFDRCDKIGSNLKDEYRWRRQNLRAGLRITVGKSQIERYCLEVLRQLINESCAKANMDDGAVALSRNQVQINNFVLGSNLLSSIFVSYSRTVTSASSLLQTVRLVLSYLFLRLPYKAHNFGATQKIVYTDSSVKPLFIGKKKDTVNIEWALHVVNFFKYHIISAHEATLHLPYQNLEDVHKPKPWKGKLQSSAEPRAIGRYWKGSYAYLDEMELGALRRLPMCFRVFVDNIDLSGGFQTLQLETRKNFDPVEKFTTFFDHLAPGTKSAEPTKASKVTKHPYLQIKGCGLDSAKYRMEGRLYEIPPQNQIPGWQRLVMMKYFIDESTEDESTYDDESLWAYEACVLPGGEIMVGRWWYASQNDDNNEEYSGPFIFWKTPHNDDCPC